MTFCYYMNLQLLKRTYHAWKCTSMSLRMHISHGHSETPLKSLSTEWITDPYFQSIYIICISHIWNFEMSNAIRFNSTSLEKEWSKIIPMTRGQLIYSMIKSSLLGIWLISNQLYSVDRYTEKYKKCKCFILKQKSQLKFMIFMNLRSVIQSERWHLYNMEQLQPWGIFINHTVMQQLKI